MITEVRGVRVLYNTRTLCWCGFMAVVLALYMLTVCVYDRFGLYQAAAFFAMELTVLEVIRRQVWKLLPPVKPGPCTHEWYGNDNGVDRRILVCIKCLAEVTINHSDLRTRVEMSSMYAKPSRDVG